MIRSILSSSLLWGNKIAKLLVITGASFFSSCLFEKSDAPLIDPCTTVTYSKSIVPIINEHCAIYGCHVTGFTTGNFLSYDTLYSKIENGTFQLRVFQLKIMPPNDSLNDDEFDARWKNWID